MEWPFAPYQSALLAAMLVFGLNFLLGLSLQLGSRWHPRPLHHALYFLTCACTLAASPLAFWAAEPWWPPLVLLGLLLLTPKTRPGRFDHAALAVVIGLGFGLTAWRML